MLSGSDHTTEVLPVIEPESLGAAGPVADEQDAATTERSCRVLKDCGDCEPGGFGSTYGYSPR